MISVTFFPILVLIIKSVMLVCRRHIVFDENGHFVQSGKDNICGSIVSAKCYTL